MIFDKVLGNHNRIIKKRIVLIDYCAVEELYLSQHKPVELLAQPPVHFRDLLVGVTLTNYVKLRFSKEER